MANRYAREKRTPYVKPVERIELDESHIKRRIVLAVLFAVIGLAAFSYAIIQFRKAEPKWTEIEVDAASGVNLSGEFTLRYHLGRGTMSPTAEKKQLVNLYSTEMSELFQLYSATKFVNNINNLYEINRRPNEEIEVDPRLYRALKVSAEQGGRILYYGPYYEYYNSLFFAGEDYLAEYFDPARSREAGEYFEELSRFIRDPEAVRMEFPAENKVVLRISDQYLSYAKEAGIEVFADLSMMQNAFAADEVCERFRSRGLINGYLVSDDGFIVNLCSDAEMNFEEYTYSDGKAAVRQSWSYTGARNIVTLRSFPLKKADLVRCYVYEDGSLVSSYINDRGLQASRFDTLSAWSETKGCAEIFFALLPYKTGEKGEKSLEEVSEELLKDGITVFQ